MPPPPPPPPPLPAFAAAPLPPLFTPPLARGSRADRVAVHPASYTRLRRRAAAYGTSASRLGGVVLDEYLAHAEAFYLGAPRARAVVATAAAARRVDAVIFDMDGVLCNSEAASRECAVAVLREMYGVVARADEFEAFTGMGEGRFLGGVAEMHGTGADDFDEAAAKARFFDMYLYGGFMRSVTAYPGVKGLVTRLREAGLKVGVASAADRVKVRANLEAVGLGGDGVFDFVTSSDDIANKKPAPDVFLAAAAGLGVAPDRCVVVEDAVAGVVAAKAAGMRCVAVATSLPRDKLDEAGADVVRGEPALISLEDLFGEPLPAPADGGSYPAESDAPVEA
jgi:HAD superfamily hydrolase (TIGR01509 family)